MQNMRQLTLSWYCWMASFTKRLWHCFLLGSHCHLLQYTLLPPCLSPPSKWRHFYKFYSWYLTYFVFSNSFYSCAYHMNLTVRSSPHLCDLPLVPLLQPHWTFWHILYLSTQLSPQRSCIWCSLYLDFSSLKYLKGLFPYLLQLSAEMLPYRWGCPISPHVK